MHQKVNVLFFSIYFQKVQFWGEIKNNFFDILLSSPSLSQKKYDKKSFMKMFLCHGFLPFLIKAPLWPLPLQNPLDHVNE